jgi:hypothetical protein
MKELFAGIYGKFAPVGVKPTIYTNLSGRLRLYEAKQGELFPYCVYSLIGDAPDYWFLSERQESYTLQFSLFTDDRSSENIGTYFNNLTALYDECDLTVSGYTFLIMRREWSYLLRDTIDSVWQYILQYNVLLEKR